MSRLTFAEKLRFITVKKPDQGVGVGQYIHFGKSAVKSDTSDIV